MESNWKRPRDRKSWPLVSVVGTVIGPRCAVIFFETICAIPEKSATKGCLPDILKLYFIENL